LIFLTDLIDYAKRSAFKSSLDITYHYQDYLMMRLNTAFDFTTMIYCDYNALSKGDRVIIMRNIHHHLKSGGKFLLVVFIRQVKHIEKEQVWEN